MISLDVENKDGFKERIEEIINNWQKDGLFTYSDIRTVRLEESKEEKIKNYIDLVGEILREITIKNSFGNVNLHDLWEQTSGILSSEDYDDWVVLVNKTFVNEISYFEYYSDIAVQRFLLLPKLFDLRRIEILREMQNNETISCSNAHYDTGGIYWFETSIWSGYENRAEIYTEEESLGSRCVELSRKYNLQMESPTSHVIIGMKDIPKDI